MLRTKNVTKIYNEEKLNDIFNPIYMFQQILWDQYKKTYTMHLVLINEIIIISSFFQFQDKEGLAQFGNVTLRILLQK